MNIIEKHQNAVREFAAGYKITDNHVIGIGASIVMTRDNVLQGGSFAQAVVDNNLREAVNRADDTCIQYLRFFVSVKNNLPPVK